MESRGKAGHEGIQSHQGHRMNFPKMQGYEEYVFLNSKSSVENKNRFGKVKVSTAGFGKCLLCISSGSILCTN